jgi:hypothetical protein
MAAQRFPRRLVRRIENRETFPLIALGALLELRAHLDEVEAEAILRAKEMGASAEDIAEALDITRQGAYYKLKQLERADQDGNDVEDIGVTLPEAETQRPNRA